MVFSVDGCPGFHCSLSVFISCDAMLRYIEFVVSRLFGTGVDTLVLWLCSTYVFDTYWGDYVVSPIISFEFAVMSNFLCSYCWIWKSRIDNRCAADFWRRFAVFNVSSALGFLVKMLFLLLFEKYSGGVSYGVTLRRCSYRVFSIISWPRR